MTKLNRLTSLFWLRCQYLMTNKILLYLCVVMPIGSFLLISFVPKYQGKIAFLMFILNFVFSMTSGCFVSIMASEEKEKKNLRTLILTGVKMQEYIAGIVLFPFTLSILACIAFPFLLKINIPSWPLYLFISFSTCIIFILASLSISFFTKNQTQATLFSYGITMVAVVLPTISQFTQNKIVDYIISLSFVGANSQYFIQSGHLSPKHISMFAMVIWIVGLLFLTKFAFSWNRKNHA